MGGVNEGGYLGVNITQMSWTCCGVNLDPFKFN